MILPESLPRIQFVAVESVLLQAANLKLEEQLQEKTFPGELPGELRWRLLLRVSLVSPNYHGSVSRVYSWLYSAF